MITDDHWIERIYEARIAKLTRKNESLTAKRNRLKAALEKIAEIDCSGEGSCVCSLMAFEALNHKDNPRRLTRSKVTP